jgi:2-aminomuconate deaminase
VKSDEQNSIIISQSAAPPVGPYPHARRAGGLVFLSGIGPRLPGGTDIPGVTLSPSGEIVDYDIAAQTHSCFRNVVAVLKEAGIGLQDVVDVQVFLVDIKRNFAAFNETYRSYFDAQTGPARTTIGVVGLPTTIHVELKVIAAAHAASSIAAIR